MMKTSWKVDFRMKWILFIFIITLLILATNAQAQNQKRIKVHGFTNFYSKSTIQYVNDSTEYSELYKKHNGKLCTDPDAGKMESLRRIKFKLDSAKNKLIVLNKSIRSDSIYYLKIKLIKTCDNDIEKIALNYYNFCSLKITIAGAKIGNLRFPLMKDTFYFTIEK